jgi:hypothetical protein
MAAHFLAAAGADAELTGATPVVVALPDVLGAVDEAPTPTRPGASSGHHAAAHMVAQSGLTHKAGKAALQPPLNQELYMQTLSDRVWSSSRQVTQGGVWSVLGSWHPMIFNTRACWLLTNLILGH